MADLGERANVMGPQPLAQRTEKPAAMLEAAERVLALISAGDLDGLAAMAAPSGGDELRAVATAARAETYDRVEIVATARVNFHHYVKARLHGAGVEPFTLQFRLGEHEGSWRVWEAINLTGRRGAWGP